MQKTPWSCSINFSFLNIANHIPSFAGFLVVIPWGVYILIKNFSSLIYVRKGSLILLISLPLAYAFSLVFISPQLHFLNTIRLVPLLFIALSAVLVVEQEKKLKLLQGLYLFLCGIIICPAIYANLSKFSYFPYATVNSLRHAEEVANIIKQDEYFTKDTTVRTAKKKQERQNAYLYFLGEDYFSKMDNAKKFSEFSEFDFSNQADCNNVYLISCEGEDSRELITKRLLGNHDLVKKISLEKCSTCQGCELEVFRCR